jgi:hypothetical protein
VLFAEVQGRCQVRTARSEPFYGLRMCHLLKSKEDVRFGPHSPNQYMALGCAICRSQGRCQVWTTRSDPFYGLRMCHLPKSREDVKFEPRGPNHSMESGCAICQSPGKKSGLDHAVRTILSPRDERLANDEKSELVQTARSKPLSPSNVRLAEDKNNVQV